MSYNATGPPDDFWGFVLAVTMIVSLFLYDSARPSDQQVAQAKSVKASPNVALLYQSPVYKRKVELHYRL